MKFGRPQMFFGKNLIPNKTHLSTRITGKVLALKLKVSPRRETAANFRSVLNSGLQRLNNICDKYDLNNPPANSFTFF
jgi:hypothetical protein